MDGRAGLNVFVIGASWEV